MSKSRIFAASAAVLLLTACADNVIAPVPRSTGAPRLAGTAPEGPITGAIWTSNTGCGAINKNIYSDRQAVYLNGGPLGNQSLKDGAYYVQVTEPNGTVLGTSIGAADEQPFVVESGTVTSCDRLWDMVISTSSGLTGYDPTTNAGGEYKVWISSKRDFDNAFSKTDNFKVREPGTPPPPQALLTIRKFYDANADGVKQTAEPLLEGWKVSLTPWGEAEEPLWTTYVANRETGNYEATEFMPVQTNWVRTTPSMIPVQFAHTSSGSTITFGNVCLAGGRGNTLGYYSNKNGQNTIAGLIDNVGGIAFLNGLGANWVGPNGSRMLYTKRGFTGTFNGFADYATYRNFLLAGNAVHMKYMLSVQLSVMELNVRYGFVSGSATIYAPGANSALDANNESLADGFTTVDALMTEAIASLNAADSPTNTRSYQEALKNALDNGNNNRAFVSPTACQFDFAP